MVQVTTDIDIDFADRETALCDLMHVSASRTHGAEFLKHQTGIYFQNVPVDPISNLCAFDYERAAENGYFKVDFLNNSIYEGIRDEDHLIALMADPPWELFEVEEIVSRLAHIKEKFGLVSMIKPQSVEDLAVILALMRPGKRYLLGKSRKEIDAEIWKKSEDGAYSFRRSHAIAYAVAITVQLNLLCEKTAQAIDEAKFVIK
jgi:hypothetical protein